MTVRTTSGTSLKVSAATPATFNSVGYTALTYTAVGEISNYGEFGRVYNVTKHNDVATRSTRKLKGNYDDGTLQLQLGLDTDDAGQILMKAALLVDTPYSFVVETQNGDKYYFQGLVTSWKVSLGAGDQVSTASCALEVTTSTGGVGIVEVLAA